VIKALFFDIDGTIVSFSSHRMTDALKAAFRTLQQKGIKLFISTGRSQLTLDNLEDYPFDGIIAMNGAMTLYEGRVIDSHPLPKDMARKVALVAANQNVPCWVFADNVVGINMENEHSRELSRQINLYPSDYLDLMKVVEEHVVYEYTIFFDKESEEKYLHPNLSGVAYQRWHPAFCDITIDGLSKAHGAAKALEAIGATREECIAFGDGGNDIALLEYAGIGVAMGNSDDEVKAKADHVTLSVDEDGVVAALHHFGLL